MPGGAVSVSGSVISFRLSPRCAPHRRSWSSTRVPSSPQISVRGPAAWAATALFTTVHTAPDAKRIENEAKSSDVTARWPPPPGSGRSLLNVAVAPLTATTSPRKYRSRSIWCDPCAPRIPPPRPASDHHVHGREASALPVPTTGVHAGVGQERGDLHLRAEPRPDHPDAQLRHLFLHAREVDHRHRVIEPNQALTAVDVAEELDQLFVPAQLRVISLDLARGYIAQRLHLDGVDDRRRHLLARPEAPADRQPDHLSGFILVPLVPQPDGGGLPAVA